MITLPKEWKIYSNSVRDRCRNLIELQIWTGIHLNDLETWRKNFISDEEKYFSACILDSLTYRSNYQTFSLINQLLFKNINNVIRINKLEIKDFPICMQQSKVDPLIRFVPSITKDDPVTKSSNEVLRFMKRYFNVSENWIVNPWQIEQAIAKGVKWIIFIDDFLGTGHQFSEVCIWSKLDKIIKNNHVIYATLVAHEDGLKFITTEHSNLIVTFTEKLTWINNSFFRTYFRKEEDLAKEFYKSFLTSKNIYPQVSNIFGYGNLELTFAFEHAAPDNSLHVLHEKNSLLQPLVKR